MEHTHSPPHCTHMSYAERHSQLQADLEIEQEKWIRQKGFVTTLSPNRVFDQFRHATPSQYSPSPVKRANSPHRARDAALGSVLASTPRRVRGSPGPLSPGGQSTPTTSMLQRTQTASPARSGTPGRRPYVSPGLVPPGSLLRLNSLERSASTPPRNLSPLVDTSKANRVSPRYKLSHGGNRKPTSSEKILSLCAEFTTTGLPVIEPTVNEVCHAAMQHNYMPEDKQRYLETTLKRITNFLNSLDFLMLPAKSKELILPPKPKPGAGSVKATWSAAELKKMRGRRAKIDRKKAQLERERALLREKQAKLNAELEKIAEKRRMIAERLAKVKPALDEALEGLNSIKDEHLWEVKSYLTPPKMVHKVMSAVLTVLGEKEHKWDRMKSYLQRKDFIPMVREVNFNNISDQTRKALVKFTSDPEFNYDNAQKASKACAPLVKWVIALQKYADVYATIRGIQEELDRTSGEEIRALQADVDEQKRLIAKLEKEIEEMEAAYEALYGEHNLHARDAEARRQAEERYEKAVIAWEIECEQLRQAHELYLIEEAGKPPVISDEAMEMGNNARIRCQAITDAVHATLGSLKHPASLSVSPLIQPRQQRKQSPGSRSNTPSRSMDLRSSTPRQNRGTPEPFNRQPRYSLP